MAPCKIVRWWLQLVSNEKLGRLGAAGPPGPGRLMGFCGPALAKLSCIGEQPSEPNGCRKFSRFIPFVWSNSHNDRTPSCGLPSNEVNIPVTSTWWPRVVKMILTRDILGAGSWLVTEYKAKCPWNSKPLYPAISFSGPWAPCPPSQHLFPEQVTASSNAKISACPRSSASGPGICLAVCCRW